MGRQCSADDCQDGMNHLSPPIARAFSVGDCAMEDNLMKKCSSIGSFTHTFKHRLLLFRINY